MDSWSKSKRSEVMSHIRSKDTKPELVVRSMLHRAGLRYSLQRKDLPGRPDIVLQKYRAVVFVHGCFWHRHKGCRVATTPKSHKEYWLEKFAINVARDKRNIKCLENAGWKVMVVWGCEVMRDPQIILKRLLSRIGVKRRISYDSLPDRRALLRVAEQKLRWSLDR
jgi:DNA mismatch endonuclease (patch repair protein)